MTLPPLPALPPLPVPASIKTLRVLAVEDFKVYREYPFFMRAVELTAPRSTFPHVKAYFDEVIRRMHQLMNPPSLPLPR